MNLTTNFINECALAYHLYLEKGMDEVKRVFPGCVEFVENNKDKEIEDVNKLLTEQLDSLELNDKGI